MPGSREVSLVLPAYNEVNRLRRCVEGVIEALEKVTDSFEIIIAEDGSTDGTSEVASHLSEEFPDVRHLHSDRRLGRGGGLKRGFMASEGDILAFMDVDLATDLSHLDELIGAIRDGFDIATGSRLMPESIVERSFKRTALSRGYNFLVRRLLGSKVRDHQCGFKAFKREVFFAIMDELEDEHWFWDTELLVLAQRKGYRIYEFPVRWRDGGMTKVDLSRDIIGMGSRILWMWRRMR
ncbi:MAG TPA: glycosyltransferase family 2 protein [Candidatus Syntrophoarchaeum butanivorans]|uniref:Dolichol-P-glucose synthetase n=1 Tax=Candidatus Syntropharchaeum butanivorans TaxID=1839936 RepID=A0A1F2P549_9EURY|nr:MAG: dolichol-P-glucose synthetase [Candidatus Syntrophoarchaeum butanivorans]RJS70551.1 MAG: glycosyltransferase family 2 protein [Candidatus Syntrophoarchaeum sp. WYZ-LMO15]RLA96111.1 MAG: glycosyltransferase family 2 protein [Deltaproteobacteria bacterium]HDM35637.1 glycosyltransferase family 2 protein [Candidatus Syntrophoarchaeum butanivorans]HEC56543.1 glycosyltransferase family 2 protein [Candidatus Syntrophoarchaeum butanivorans]